MGRLNEDLWTPTLQWYSRYDVFHLTPIVQKIAVVVREAPNAKVKAVYTKYLSSKLLKISQNPELYGPYMDSIIDSESV